MRALTVVPGETDSLELSEVEAPARGDDELLVDGLAVGVCGTDKEITAGEYGWAPPGRQRLVIGHESLGRVREAPPGSDVAAGDLVAGAVRRPDPVPFGACAHADFGLRRHGGSVGRDRKRLQ